MHETAALRVVEDDPIGALCAVRDALAERFVERRVEAELLVLCLAARTNLTLVGEPGVAKSQLVGALGACLVGAAYFEAQLAPDTPPQAVLGPYSLPDLDRGVFRTNTAGMLPEAHLGLLDEGYRASPLLLDHLLGLAHPTERRYHNGPRVEAAPLWSLIITCNRLPEADDERTEAFRDRMTLTRLVAPVAGDEGRAAILAGQLARDTVAPLPQLHRQGVEAAQALVATVACPEDFLADALRLWRLAEEASLPVSARRMGELVRLCRARAALAGRDRCRREDLRLAEHVLWRDPEDHPVALEVATEFAGRAARRLIGLRAAREDAATEAREVLAALGALPPEQMAPAELTERATRAIRALSELARKTAEAADAAMAEGAPEASELTGLGAEAERERTALWRAVVGES